MTELTIGKRKIPLVFDMDSWIEIEENVCALSRLNEVVGQHNMQGRKSDMLRSLVAMVRIMGNEGLELDGQPKDLTDEWLKKNIRPGQMLDIKVAVITEIDKGMRLETVEYKENEERDLVLEEINKKKTRRN